MKINTTLKNTKTDNQVKISNVLGANHKTVRYNGNTYMIYVATLGGTVLASVQMMKGNAPVLDLYSKTDEAKDIKKLIEQGYVS